VPPYLSSEGATVVVDLAAVGAEVVGLAVVAAVVVAGLVVVVEVLLQAASIRLITRIKTKRTNSVFFIYASK
jgi:hypothetical protein